MISKLLNSTVLSMHQPPAVCYPNQSECSATETGKMSSGQDEDLVPKKINVYSVEVVMYHRAR